MMVRFAFGKLMIRALFFSSVLLSNIGANAANPTRLNFELIDLPITVRVDTTDTDIKAVYDLVRGFLSSRPDSLYDNPFWNDGEKKKYPEPFSARRMVFQAPDITYSFPPKILSIEKEGDFYCTRILFYREGLEGQYIASNPWAIVRFYSKKDGVKKTKEEKKIEKESGITDHREYRLFDPLKILTKNWKNTRIGPIEFYYPFNFYFDNRTAQQMAQFCRGLKNKYLLPDVEPIEFYISRNVDELAEIVGLDYILGPTSGRSQVANAQVFSALGSEWYPHEIVHIFFRDFKPHFLLMEGIATYEGGSLNVGFNELVKQLNDYLITNDTLTFQNFLDNPFQEKGTFYYYTVGAVLCKMADQKGGSAAVKALLEAGNDNEQLYQKIESVLGIKRDAMTGALRAKVKEYAAP
ncbi:MAG: hypothetical protein ACREBV_01930 [Candidatus Zixiibacteriota bacterium]